MDRQKAHMPLVGKLILATLLLFPIVAFIIRHGAILDARLERGPLDPELIDCSCPVHNVTLKENIVSIQYGFPDFPEGYWEARRAQFPYANSRYLGGCVLQKPMIARVRYCPECRKAEKEWKATADQ
jgi:hypothetical protein